MKKCFACFASLLLTLSAGSVAASTVGPHAQVLHSFAGKSDGNFPYAGLLADSSGNLYGTTEYGGRSMCLTVVYGCGTVFELSPPSGLTAQWTETVLYRFSGESDGALPTGKLISDQQGNLYGTTGLGGDLSNDLCRNGGGHDTGCGVVFELSPPTAQGGEWTETVLYSFTGANSAAYPAAGLVFDVAGNLYGTAAGGGGSLFGGVVFELSPPQIPGDAWSYANLYQFSGQSDGGLPFSDLIFDSVSNLYGTTCIGGSADGGTVFELSPSSQQGGGWTENVLHSFPLNSCPRAGIVFDSSGNLYGTVSGGYGYVFEMTPSLQGEWTEKVIYAFSKNSDESPYASPTLDRFGNVYGTDTGAVCGSVYRLQAGSWLESEYDFFNNHGDPCYLLGALIFGNNGAIFGTSGDGGAFKKGTVFVIH